MWPHKACTLVPVLVRYSLDTRYSTYRDVPPEYYSVYQCTQGGKDKKLTFLPRMDYSSTLGVSASAFGLSSAAGAHLYLRQSHNNYSIHRRAPVGSGVSVCGGIASHWPSSSQRYLARTFSFIMPRNRNNKSARARAPRVRAWRGAAARDARFKRSRAPSHMALCPWRLLSWHSRPAIPLTMVGRAGVRGRAGRPVLGATLRPPCRWTSTGSAADDFLFENLLDDTLEMELMDVGISEEMRTLLAERPKSSLTGHEYYAALLQLQRRLIALQDHIVEKGLRVVVLFEGRDSAGKGGASKRITQHLDPRVSSTFVRNSPHFTPTDSRFDRKCFPGTGVPRGCAACAHTL